MPDAIAELREDVARANRMLAREGVLDVFGHVSVRHPRDPKPSPTPPPAPPPISWCSA